MSKTLIQSSAGVRLARTELTALLSDSVTALLDIRADLERAGHIAKVADLRTPGARHTVIGAREQLDLVVEHLRGELDEVLTLTAEAA